MRGRRLMVALGVAVLAGPAVWAQDSKPPRPVAAIKTWSGIIRDEEKLKKQAPTSGYLSDATMFEKLWKVWRPKEEVPKVDFSKQLVLVATVGGPNRIALSASLDDAGDLKVQSRSTLIGGPGFGYALATISRAGIKTFRGKPLK